MSLVPRTTTPPPPPPEPAPAPSPPPLPIAELASHGASELPYAPPPAATVPAPDEFIDGGVKPPPPKPPYPPPPPAPPRKLVPLPSPSPARHPVPSAEIAAALDTVTVSMAYMCIAFAAMTPPSPTTTSTQWHICNENGEPRPVWHGIALELTDPADLSTPSTPLNTPSKSSPASPLLTTPPEPYTYAGHCDEEHLSSPVESAAALITPRLFTSTSANRSTMSAPADSTEFPPPDRPRDLAISSTREYSASASASPTVTEPRSATRPSTESDPPPVTSNADPSLTSTVSTLKTYDDASGGLGATVRVLDPFTMSDPPPVGPPSTLSRPTTRSVLRSVTVTAGATSHSVTDDVAESRPADRGEAGSP